MQSASFRVFTPTYIRSRQESTYNIHDDDDNPTMRNLTFERENPVGSTMTVNIKI